MSIDRPFREPNFLSRQRLTETVARLTDADLVRQAPNGWTVANSLAHVAFWDRRAFVLAAKWQRGGTAAPSPVDLDVLNDAVDYLIRLVPPRLAAEEAVAAAEAIDRILEDVGDDILARILETSTPLANRSAHRISHLDEIEALVGRH